MGIWFGIGSSIGVKRAGNDVRVVYRNFEEWLSLVLMLNLLILNEKHEEIRTSAKCFIDTNFNIN